jgi:uncharacterized protein YcfL
MKKFTFFLLISFLFLSCHTTSANESVVPQNLTETSTGLTITKPIILENIALAKQKLNEVRLNYDIKKTTKTVVNKKTKKKSAITSYNLKAKDIALAIFNPKTNSIEVVLGMQTGKKIIFNNPNFNVKLKRFNGVNSSFEVNTPEDGYVLALKYLITPTETSVNKSSIESRNR